MFSWATYQEGKDQENVLVLDIYCYLGARIETPELANMHDVISPYKNCQKFHAFSSVTEGNEGNEGNIVLEGNIEYEHKVLGISDFFFTL